MSGLHGLIAGASGALPLYAIRPASVDDFMARLSPQAAAFLRGAGFHRCRRQPAFAAG